MPWLQVARCEPQERGYRVRCNDGTCLMATTPTEFTSRLAAESWAQDHANLKQHVTVVEARE